MRSLTLRDVAFARAVIPEPSLTWVRKFDFSNASTVTISTGISQIDDLSGNAGHATQGTGAAQPAYTTAARNGLNVGTFDGTDDRLVTATNVTSAQPNQVYLVARLTSVTSTNQQLFGNGASSKALIYKTATTNLWALYNGTTLSSAVAADTNWHVFVGNFQGVSSFLMIDGVSVASGSAGTTNLSAEALSAGATSSGSSPAPVQIGFVALGAQSPTDRDAMVAHLKSKWAIG